MTATDSATAAAIAALVVSLFALLTAIGQLIQQYLGAADGYRRCQTPIIGKWAKHTRLRFRWREFRFEVVFQVPVISVKSECNLNASGRDPPPGDKYNRSSLPSNNALGITGTSLSRRLTLSTQILPEENQVGWLSLIDRLQDLQQKSEGQSIRGSQATSLLEATPLPHSLRLYTSSKDFQSQRSIPAISTRRSSWDFMPSGILRPVASSTLGEIIILAHRLGMGWRQLQPGLGVMHAEGNGQTLTGSMLHGFGVILHYTRDQGFEARSQGRERMNLIIPTEEADKMAFGIIAGDERLDMPDLAMTAEDGSFSEMEVSMAVLNISSRAQDQIRGQWMNRSIQNAWHEVICLSCPFLPIVEENTINCALRPCPQIASPLLWREGRTAFRMRSQHLINKYKSSGSFPDLVKHLERLHERYITGWTMTKIWETQHFLDKSKRNHYDRSFLLYLKQQHDWTVDYFLGKHENTLKHERGQNLTFKDLVGAHITMAAKAILKVEENMKSGTKRDLGEAAVPGGLVMFMFEQFQVYVDFLPMVAKRLKEAHGIEDEELVSEAWWTLMWRGIVWWLSVQILGGPHRTADDRKGLYVPSVYWGSKVPVYIA